MRISTAAVREDSIGNVVLGRGAWSICCPASVMFITMGAMLALALGLNFTVLRLKWKLRRYIYIGLLLVAVWGILVFGFGFPWFWTSIAFAVIIIIFINGLVLFRFSRKNNAKSPETPKSIKVDEEKSSKKSGDADSATPNTKYPVRGPHSSKEV